MTSESASMN